MPALTTTNGAALALTALVLSAWSLQTAHSFVAHPGTTCNVADLGHAAPSQTLLSSSVVGVEPSSALDADIAADAEISIKKRGTSKQRGKFHAGVYDKPIVLLGCSGGNDEIARLANSLSKSAEDAGATTGISSSTGNHVTISTPSDLTSIQAKIDRGELDRSHVIIVDFAASSAETTTCLTDAAKSLYADSGLLSIYVNVHPAKSQMSEEDVLLKSQLESTVFLPNTDYELSFLSG